MCAESKAAVAARCDAARRLLEVAQAYPVLDEYGIGRALRLVYPLTPLPADMRDTAAKIGERR